MGKGTRRIALLAALATAAPVCAAPEVEYPPPALVLELFTSQGCSSCPPADRLLSSLGRAGSVGGVRVAPLAFHVDYWNHIGWTDPFSSAAWSDRQRDYRRRFRLRSIYTPQLVVGGADEGVGSDGSRVRSLIAGAVPPPGRVRVEVREGGDRLDVAVTTRLTATVGAERLDVLVALFESGLTTPVGAGENVRATLRNDFVVRRLSRAGQVPGAPSGDHRDTVTLDLEPAWRRSQLGVAAFLQDPETLRILGADRVDLAAE